VTRWGATQLSILVRRWGPFAVAAALTAVWTFAMPLYAGPDEPAHVVRAAATARGEIVGKTVAGEVAPASLVHVPAAIAARSRPPCFAMRPSVAASCPLRPRPDPPADPREATTHVGRYPPAYYVLVGAASLADARPARAVYLMRLVSALIAAALVASAWASARAWRGGAGLALAVTPVALFLGGSVNPNGTEILAGVALWAGALGLAELGEAAPASLVARTGSAACVLVLVRSSGPLWLALAALVLLVAAPAGCVRALARRRDVRGWLAALAASGAAALWWARVAGGTGIVPSSNRGTGTTAQLLWRSAGRTMLWVRQMVGTVGWNDAPAPAWTAWAWAAAVVLLVAGALVRGRPRARAAVLLAVALPFAVSVVVQTLTARRYGFYWQGRYVFPLAAGIPLTAVWAYRPGRAATRAVVAAVVAVHLTTLLWALRRWTIGTGHSGLGLVHVSWHPPLPPVLLLAADAALLAVAAYAVLPTTRERRGQQAQAGP
jgi:hypothetical protein